MSSNTVTGTTRLLDLSAASYRRDPSGVAVVDDHGTMTYGELAFDVTSRYRSCVVQVFAQVRALVMSIVSDLYESDLRRSASLYG